MKSLELLGFSAMTLTNWHQKVPETVCLNGLHLTGAKLTTGNYWFDRFPRISQKTFLFLSICGCPLLC